MSKLKPPFKVHGCKYSLCDWIIQYFPENYKEMVYLEPFCGAASILVNKESSFEEAINDEDKGIIKIMRAIRDQKNEFISCLRKIRCTKKVFEKACTRTEFVNDLDEAINEYILRRMSRGGLKKTFAWTNRQKITTLANITKIAKRIENVYVFNKPAIDVLNAFNQENTLAYIDPPEIEEFTEEQHIKLADLLRSYKGKVIISSIVSPFYIRLYKSWRCVKKKPAGLKPECIWLNY